MEQLVHRDESSTENVSLHRLTAFQVKWNFLLNCVKPFNMFNVNITWQSNEVGGKRQTCILQQSLESAERGCIGNVDGEIIPRGGKPDRVGCFSP